MPYIELSKLKHLLTEVNPQPKMEGQCELCGKTGMYLYMVGGTYACRDCRTAIITRLKEGQNPVTGLPHGVEAPPPPFKKADAGPFGTSGYITPAPVDKPRQSPFAGYVQQQLKPALNAYLDANALQSNDTINQLLTQQTMAEKTRELHEEWLRQRGDYKSVRYPTAAPASGESSTPAVAASSASASGREMQEVSHGGWSAWTSSMQKMQEWLNSSGSPTGQPSAKSSKSSSTPTMTKAAEYLYANEMVPFDTRAEAKKLVDASTVEKVAEMTVTWPFPEEESQPVIGQLLPLDIKPER